MSACGAFSRDNCRDRGAGTRGGCVWAASTDDRLKALEQQLQDVNTQLADLKRSQSDQYGDVNRQFDGRAGQARQWPAHLHLGRRQFQPRDPRAGAARLGLLFAECCGGALPAAYGPNLSSGTNFRRVYLGMQGKIFGDWSYNLNFDFGGSGGTETPGHIQSVYLQYDGLAPFAFRVGAYPAPANIEDSTSAGDTIFLERNAPSDLQRNIAGGDGRDAVSLLYTGDEIFGALSYTGAKVQDAAVFDEQQALFGSPSDRIWHDCRIQLRRRRQTAPM